MFKDKQTCFFEEVANLHSKKKGSQSIFVERGMIVESVSHLSVMLINLFPYMVNFYSRISL